MDRLPAPVRQALQSDVIEVLKDGRSRTAGRSGKVWRNALIVGEMSLSLLLLAGCALMIETFWKLSKLDSGFDASHVLTVRNSLGGEVYLTAAARRAHFDLTAEKLAANRWRGIGQHSQLPRSARAVRSGAIRTCSSTKRACTRFERQHAHPHRDAALFQNHADRHPLRARHRFSRWSRFGESGGDFEHAGSTILFEYEPDRRGDSHFRHAGRMANCQSPSCSQFCSCPKPPRTPKRHRPLQVR
jgi:hypothetical protein